MATKTDAVILPESESAARLTTVTGWVSRNGEFCGDNEAMARRFGATHFPCNGGCGALVPPTEYRRLCRACRDRSDSEQYAAAERAVPGPGVMLYSDVFDCYYNDVEDLMERCADNGDDPAKLRVYICEPHYARECPLDAEFFDDLLPEEGELPDEIQEAIDAFNAAVKACDTPLSWTPTKVAAILPAREEPDYGD